MVTLGCRVTVRVSFRVRIAFVLTLVARSGMHIGLRFRSGFALPLRLGLGFGLSAAVRIPTL